MTGKTFNLFSNCIPARGANRSIICDTQNNTYYFIPNGLYDILEKYNGETIDCIKSDLDNKYDDIVDEYFEFLYSNNLIFFSSKPEFFPKIKLDWKSPSLVTNMVIDYDYMEHDFESIIDQLEELKCSYIQLRFYRETRLEKITELSKILERAKSRVVSVDFILPYSDIYCKDKLDKILKEYPRIHSIIVFKAINNHSYPPIREKMGYLMFVTKNILNEKHCGIINSEYFYSNIKLFSESQYHNTCLNRKISIDKEGNIKNCPSMKQSFGNIKDTKLIEAIDHPDFKKYWNVTKDQIEVCKDCEFRHICTDCRAYTEHPDDQYSKPLKCGYDPYTNKWEEWSTNPLKQKAIEYYGMQDLVNREDQ